MKKNAETRHKEMSCFQKTFLMMCAMLCFSFAAKAQVEITGVVIDTYKDPIPGAIIKLKGGTVGTTTDVDGKYKLSVPEKSTLEFSFMGYKSQEVAVGSQQVINITLFEDQQLLDEIVVVAYGTQRKSSLTGAISTIKTDQLKGVTASSVGNMMQGKVAGVAVTNMSGQPGSKTNIRVRGTGSANGIKEPLWVVDGVVGGMSSELNPNDIETLSILKDGGATALYGSRGANGVILVTTKKGLLGESKLNVNAKMGVATLQKGELRIMNGAEHYEFAKTAMENAQTTRTWLSPKLAGVSTNWWDIATQNALSQNYNVNYTTGTDKIRSYLAADYYQEEGTIKGFDYERFTLRSNTDFIINSKLTIKTKLSGSYWRTKDQEYALGYYTYLPWDTPYDSAGNLKTGNEEQPQNAEEANGNPEDYWYGRVKGNYLYDRHLNWTRKKQNAMDVGLGLEYKIFDFLTFESNNQFGYKNQYEDEYTDPNSRGGKATKGKIQYNTYYTRSRYTSQMLRFVNTFNKVHEVSAFLGYDFDDTFYQWAKSSATSIVSGAEIIGAGTDGHKVEGKKELEKNAAIFFNSNYAFDSKYLFQFSLRRDGSSRFGEDKKWATFYAVGGGWNMHKESFIKNLEFVDELKLRATYGTTGNVPQFRNGYMTLYQINQEYAGEPAFLSNYAGNPDLAWEKTNSLDLGFNFRLFNRVSVDFDVYSKKVANMLYLRRLSAITGFNNQNANDGKMENKGYEITITPDIIRTKDMLWSVSLNLGYNTNEVTALPKENYEGNKALAIGYSLNSHYMPEWAGVDPMTGDPLWYKIDKETGEKLATGIYSEATNIIAGRTLPKFNGGINTNFTYKDFTLNASFIFAAGAKLYNGGRSGSYDRDGEDITQPAMKLKKGWSRWEKPGDIATHPRLIDGNLNSSTSPSTRYLENVDFFKMKSISISYSLPKKILAPMGIKSAEVSVGGENLFTITEFSGLDPEIYLSTRIVSSDKDHAGTAGTDGYPTVRRFTFGLSVNF